MGNLRQIGHIHASDLPQRERQEQQQIKQKELPKNNKKTQPRDTCTMRHMHNTHWTSNADNRLTPSQVTTKQARAAMTTTKTKITIFILIKK
jgi:hypothetical protein